MKALAALLLGLLALVPASAAERVVPPVLLPSAPLAAAVAAPVAAPAPPAFGALPAGRADIPALAALPASRAFPAVAAAVAGPEDTVAGNSISAAALNAGPPNGGARASAALAAISKFAAEVPPASASSLEDGAARARALAGLLNTEPVRGPPRAGAAAPAEEGPETGVVRVPDVSAALAALRAASFPRHADTDALVARLAADHPELPLTAEHVFLVKDAAVLPAYGVPSAAAGAARIVSDGRREAKIVILVAGRGVPLDDFVEYSIHEAVHLGDDGILRISHQRFVEHLLAEGWTQLRAHDMANASLRALGRPARPNGAYSQEVALARAFVAEYGEAPLRELVERGSDAGLRRALGARWDGLLALAAENPASTVRQREYFLKLMAVVITHPEFGPLDFRNASRALHGERPS